jgi:hypothetical protein
VEGQKLGKRKEEIGKRQRAESREHRENGQKSEVGKRKGGKWLKAGRRKKEEGEKVEGKKERR